MMFNMKNLNGAVVIFEHIFVREQTIRRTKSQTLMIEYDLDSQFFLLF